MSELADKIGRELDELRTLRDELRIQVHLGKKDAQGYWEKAEKSWNHLEGRLKVLGEVTQESAEEVGEAARLLADEIRHAYKHLKAFL